MYTDIKNDVFKIIVQQTFKKKILNNIFSQMRQKIG